MDIVINCKCIDNSCSGYGLIIATNADLNTWRLVAKGITNIECPYCGCTQDLVDGGHCVSGKDTAAPRIDSVSPIQGFSGNSLTIRGHRLDCDGLIVKIGSANAIITAHSANSVTVTVPVNTQGKSYDISVSNDNGCRMSGGILKDAFYYLI